MQTHVWSRILPKERFCHELYLLRGGSCVELGWVRKAGFQLMPHYISCTQVLSLKPFDLFQRVHPFCLISVISVPFSENIQPTKCIGSKLIWLRTRAKVQMKGLFMLMSSSSVGTLNSSWKHLESDVLWCCRVSYKTRFGLLLPVSSSSCDTFRGTVYCQGQNKAETRIYIYQVQYNHSSINQSYVLTVQNVLSHIGHKGGRGMS